MTKLPATDSAAYINAQLLNDVVPVRPLDLFQAFRKADLAAAAADTVVAAGRANPPGSGTWASPDDIKLAALLRAAADQLFKVTMREWARLDPLS